MLPAISRIASPTSENVGPISTPADSVTSRVFTLPNSPIEKSRSGISRDNAARFPAGIGMSGSVSVVTIGPALTLARPPIFISGSSLLYEKRKSVAVSDTGPTSMVAFPFRRSMLFSTGSPPLRRSNSKPGDCVPSDFGPPSVTPILWPATLTLAVPLTANVSTLEFFV